MRIITLKRGINLSAKYLIITKQELVDMTVDQYQAELRPQEFKYGHSMFYISAKSSRAICGYKIAWDKEMIVTNKAGLRIYVGDSRVTIHPKD